MFRIVYLGYSEAMLRYLIDDDDFELFKVFGVNGRMNAAFYSIINKQHIDYIEVCTKKEFIQKFKDIKQVDAVIMYKFEYILPQEIIQSVRVINFHGGDLNTNRGAHAVVWSVLLRERQTCMSCYELCARGGVDEGYLIDTYPVSILAEDDPAAVNRKLAAGIPELLGNVKRYLNGEINARFVSGGNYRRKIIEKDYTIDTCQDSFSVMAGKILSQKPYEGAVVWIGQEKRRADDYSVQLSNTAYTENSERIMRVENDSVYIAEGYEKIWMKLK